jgi:hypothetical protein
MTNHWKLAALVGLVQILGEEPADDWDGGERQSVLTLREPMLLAGAELPAGIYLFQVPAPLTAPCAVRIWCQSRPGIDLTATTELIVRPGSLPGDRAIWVSAGTAGSVRRLVSWFPAGSRRGYRFLRRH